MGRIKKKQFKYLKNNLKNLMRVGGYKMCGHISIYYKNKEADEILIRQLT